MGHSLLAALVPNFSQVAGHRVSGYGLRPESLVYCGGYENDPVSVLRGPAIPCSCRDFNPAFEEFLFAFFGTGYGSNFVAARGAVDPTLVERVQSATADKIAPAVTALCETEPLL
jgi:hypothetical protein